MFWCPHPSLCILLHARRPYLHHTATTKTTGLDDWCWQRQVADSPSHSAAHVNVLNSTRPAPLPSWRMFAVRTRSSQEPTGRAIRHNYKKKKCVRVCEVVQLCVLPVWRTAAVRCCLSAGQRSRSQTWTADDRLQWIFVFSARIHHSNRLTRKVVRCMQRVCELFLGGG